MGLFDRQKTSFYDSQPLYTLGNEKLLLIVGLGNIGAEYDNTRHNVGFMALDKYQTTHDFSGWTTKKDLQAVICSANIGSTKVILAKPTTFMNNSGDAAQKIQKFYRVYNQNTIVVHDELDLDFGTIRTKTGGSSAGHNGIKSLSQHIGEDYGRIRIGIGPKTHEKMDSADFVLQEFNKDQKEKLTKIIRETCALLDERTAGDLQERTIAIT